MLVWHLRSGETRRLGSMDPVSRDETWTDPQGADPSSYRLIGGDRELGA
jgi:hypothetical protein